MRSELRVGNVVLLEGRIVTLTDEFWCGTHQVEGVILTEELLFKLNYRKQDNGPYFGPYYFDTQYGDKYTTKINGLFYRDGYFYVLGGCVKPPVIHLHQLQNIFFVLSGEELQIPEIL